MQTTVSSSMNMMQEHEGVIRLSVFVGVFALMAVWEIFGQKRVLTQPKLQRWLTNWALVVVNSVAVRLFVPILAVSFAVSMQEQSVGVMNFVEMPVWLSVILSVVILDCCIYFQHVLSHRIPMLWRLHKVHHADRDIDVTTGARFHPLEIIFSMFYKLVCIFIFGVPAIAVFLFEIILNASAMFNHSNVSIKAGIDKVLRLLIVTPDMHRVHHSELPDETNSNYGFFLPWWDRLFNTYIDQPKYGHDDMTIGLREYQTDNPSKLAWSMLLPFKK